MNHKKLLFGSFLAGLILAATRLFFAKSRPKKPAPNTATYDAIVAYIEGEMRRLNIPGVSLAIVEGDKITYLRGFGRARPGGEVPTPQTPFFIASLTKSFTSLAIMQLVEAGKVELDAPVQRYLPWFRVADSVASTRLTVRHLLYQTSGLPNSAGEIMDFDESPAAAERQARALSTIELVHPVGSSFEYSNSNYQLLGLIIESISGESYADYIQAHIFDPLGMRHSYTSKEQAKENGLAIGHQYWFMHPIPAPHMPLVHAGMASGLLISCAEDLAQYLIANINGGSFKDTRIVSEAGLHELHTGPEPITVQGESFKYGMGWFNSDLGPTQLIWHGGTLPDFGAFIGFLPEQKKGVVILFNACHHHMNVMLAGVGMNVCAILIGGQPGPSPFDNLPLEQRNRLLVPAIQILDIASTMYLLHHWRLHPEQRPGSLKKWGIHILPPLIHNLLVARTTLSMLGSRRRYLMYYMPDYSWTALIFGTFAAVWAFLRTGLILRGLRKDHP